MLPANQSIELANFESLDGFGCIRPHVLASFPELLLTIAYFLSSSLASCNQTRRTYHPTSNLCTQPHGDASFYVRVFAHWHRPVPRPPALRFAHPQSLVLFSVFAPLVI